MPQIGELYWQASVKGVDEAQRQADSLEGSMGAVGAAAGAAASRQEDLAERTGEVADETETANRWSRRFKGTQGLLASALFFTTDMLGVTTGVMWGYTAATQAATFATTTLYGVIAGPAGLAAGLLTGVLAVGLFASELLGLTDVTPVVETEMDTMEGLFADLAYLVAGPVVGYLSSAWSLITGDFEAAKNKFLNTSVEWAKAAARFASRVKLGFVGAGIAVKTGVRSTIEAADFAWRAGLNTLIGATNTATEAIHDGLVGGLGSAVNGAIGLINGFINEYNKYASQVPGLDLTAGTLGTVNFGTGGRNVGRIGQVANEGLDSRLRRVSNAGNRELAAARRQARAELAAYAPDTIGGDRRTTTRQSPAIGTQEINVQIGDQSLDMRDLSRSERRDLARLIGDELGSSTTGISGVK